MRRCLYRRMDFTASLRHLGTPKRIACEITSQHHNQASSRLNSVCYQRRHFRFGKSQPEKVAVDETVYDKQYSHWSGKLFGIPMDRIIYYLKINGGVFLIVGTIYLFFQGYVWLSHFSLATVGKMGFMGGFVTCAVLYTLLLTVRRMYHISPNAVYNQAIAIAMKNPDVLDHLGSAPRTGEFKAYCASGGFKLPLLRRLRSGQYELSDFLGTKPRRLQMMFVLRSTGGNEGLVSCEVRKSHSKLFSSSYYFQSLSVHLSGKKKESRTVIVIGGENDVVYQGILKL